MYQTEQSSYSLQGTEGPATETPQPADPELEAPSAESLDPCGDLPVRLAAQQPSWPRGGLVPTWVGADLAAVAGGFWIAQTIRREAVSPFLWAILPGWVACLAAYGLYDHRRPAMPAEEARRLFHATAVATTLTLLAMFILHTTPPRSELALVWGCALLAVGGMHIGVRRIMRILQARGWWAERVLVVGTNDEARLIARTLARQPWLGWRPVGFAKTREDVANAELELPVVGSAADLADAVKTAEAKLVVVASTALDSGALPGLYTTLQMLDVDVRVSAGLSHVSASRVTVEPLDGLAMLAVRPNQLTGQQQAVKRAVDLVASVVLLVLAAPLMAIIACVIKLTSDGPAIFRQVRVGEGGHPFVIYKFRTMIDGAEDLRRKIIDLNEADGPLFKVEHDPRTTRVGQWLRHLGLDELPQLWNVLRGEMSLVGPRPPLPDETLRYDEWVRGRLRVKPGITGLWQVSGRHELGFADYVRYDLFYIENWSLFADASILLRTLPVILRGGVA